MAATAEQRATTEVLICCVSNDGTVAEEVRDRSLQSRHSNRPRAAPHFRRLVHRGPHRHQNPYDNDNLLAAKVEPFDDIICRRRKAKRSLGCAGPANIGYYAR
jgi:hypothetical protein